MSDPLLEVADELYALAPGDFIGARNARAKELRDDKRLAARIKALRKASVAAWVVNLLVRREADQVARLLKVGAALRRAQEGLDADQLRELTRQRRSVTSALAGRARGLAAEEGQRLTPAVLAQVEDTLTAAMLDEGAAAAVRSGLLVGTFRATGVEAVEVADALAAPEAVGFAASAREAVVAVKPTLHVVPDPDAEQKARAAAARELDLAQETLDQREGDWGRARRAEEELRARELQVGAEIDEARRRLADAEESMEEVEEELAQAEQACEEAEHALAEATRERDAAANRLAGLD